MRLYRAKVGDGRALRPHKYFELLDSKSRTLEDQARPMDDMRTVFNETAVYASTEEEWGNEEKITVKICMKSFYNMRLTSRSHGNQPGHTGKVSLVN